MKYRKPSKKSCHNKTTKPKGDLDPLGAIGSAGCCSPTKLKVFDELGVASEHVEESYLAIFLAYWLCKFVFPKDDVNFIRPGAFKVASKMVAGESFSLVILILANIYDGLSIVLNSTCTEDHAAVLPYHYVYGLLGKYFGTHFPSSTLDKSRPSSLTSVKSGPLITKYSSVFSTKSLDDL
ncbi:hypothetical protein EV2_044725 [Malus domestica]